MCKHCQASPTINLVSYLFIFIGAHCWYLTCEKGVENFILGFFFYLKIKVLSSYIKKK